MKITHLLKFLKKIHAFVTRASDRACYCSQAWFAKRFERSVPTILRWVAELKRLGWLVVQKRGQTSARYFVTQSGELAIMLLDKRSSDRSDDRSGSPSNKEVLGFKESKQTLGGDSNPKPVQKPNLLQKVLKQMPPDPSDQLWREYVAAFENTGKPLNDKDWRKACYKWVGMDIAKRKLALAHARDLAQDHVRERKNHKYMPFPAAHLEAEGWTRVSKTREPTADEEMENYGYTPL